MQYVGRCEMFVLIDVVSATKDVAASSEMPVPECSQGQLPSCLETYGVTHVIASDKGTRVRCLFQEDSIPALTRAPTEHAAVLVCQSLNGTLASDENACRR